MNSAEKIEQVVKQVRIKTRAAIDERILADATAALGQTNPNRPPSLWRVTMTSKWTKLGGVAATIAIAAVLISTLMNGGATEAYALEQTLEANQGLKTIHVKISPPENVSENDPENVNDKVSEAWVQFDENGELERARLDLIGEEGPKEAVLDGDGRAEVWIKAKRIAGKVRDERIVERITKEMLKHDPKRVTQGLYQREADGDVVIEMQTSDDGDEPIVLIETPTDGDGWKAVYKIDPVTKLVSEQTRYELEDDKYRFAWRRTYLDYNVPIPPSRFVLTIPEDAIWFDQTVAVGLSKGDLSDEEIASQVAHAFCDAIVAKDYARAGALYSGLQVAYVEEVFKMYGYDRVVAVVSVGQPYPCDKYEGTLLVPCEFEVEVDGVRSSLARKLIINEVHHYPDRWAVVGGF